MASGFPTNSSGNLDLSSLIPGLSQLLQGFGQQSNDQRRQNANTFALNWQTPSYELAMQSLFGNGDPNGPPGLYGQVTSPTTQNIQRQLQALYGDGTDANPGLFSTTNSQNSSIFNPDNLLKAFSNGQYDPYGQNTPGLSQANQNFNDLLPQLQGNSAQASNIFQNGGWSPQNQSSFDNLSGLSHGQSGNQQNLSNVSQQLLDSGGTSNNQLSNNFMQAGASGLYQGLSGSNPMLNFANQQAQGIAGQGGQTGPTNQGIGTSLGLTANNGMTNPLSQLSNAGGSVLNSRGGTPTNQALQGLGLNLASQPSLVSPQQAMSVARDQAGTQYQNNMEAAIRQAQSRGGGAGSTVANGQQNQGLADYSDAGSKAEAQAVENALMNQQGLQLNQANMGGQMAQGGAGLQNSTLGLGGNFIQGANSGALGNVSTGLSSLDQLAGLQSQRQLSSLGLVPNIAQTGFNEANIFGNLGLGSSGQNLQSLGLGGQFAQDVTGSQLGANDSLNSLLGQTQKYSLGAGDLANQGSNDMSSIIQSMLSGNLQAGNQGLNRTGQYFNNAQQGIGNNQNLMNFSGNQFLGSSNTGTSQLSQMLNWLGGNQNAINGTLRNGTSIVPDQNPFNSAIGSLGTAGLGGILGALGLGG